MIVFTSLDLPISFLGRITADFLRALPRKRRSTVIFNIKTGTIAALEAIRNSIKEEFVLPVSDTRLFGVANLSDETAWSENLEKIITLIA